ncbi:hypothetical protein FXV77_12815 [Sphingobacterium phlebotomi]|uniref:DUF4350 domain-containing protein n=1 Tax=Sphingobacterium phlebotomi TaxID=2605433 RepID=A0A5D4H5N6_9SPHI|nr:hypothetical protein [Sphingobacterium phlebotomi]TYR35592.1 hypothetical protein FXV77_12815 [Sphingobacterium phlebotomi]
MNRLFVIGILVLLNYCCLFAQQAGTINYNDDKDIKLLFDYYHHNLPSTKVGNHIVTGSWLDSDGRYGWNDFVHTNTLDHAYTILSKEYSISMGRSPYSEQLLKGFDGVVIFAADNPDLIAGAKVISDQEISVLEKFVEEGGSLMLMLNAMVEDRFSESFETNQVKKLLRKFGLAWNNDDTHYSDNVIPTGHPYFYDVPVFHYGAGCTLNILPEAKNPEVLLDVYSDSTYTDRSVSGPGIVLVRPGKGKVILVGDAGSWTGNISRPWADNGKILQQLFRYMKPDRDIRPAVYERDKPLHYEVTVTGLQAVPGANSLSKIAHPKYRMFSPRPTTDMPYFEASADLKITAERDTVLNAFHTDIDVQDFRWFDQPTSDRKKQSISMMISKQGKVSDVHAEGWYAQWLSPDLPIISALLPVDGLQPGDSWQSLESVRVPALRATDLPSVKTVDVDILYAKDTVHMGKSYRYLVSSGEAWLSDWDIKIEDLLPKEETQRVGGSNYHYLNERGGKILFKREQFVDRLTGHVVEARLQTRIISWIQDKRRPTAKSNLDKDNEAIISLATITTFKLKQ